MGSSGSTCRGWHRKKGTVEDSLELEVHWLLKVAASVEKVMGSSAVFLPLAWMRGEQPVAGVGVWLDRRGGVLRMILAYQVTPYDGQPQSIRTGGAGFHVLSVWWGALVVSVSNLSKAGRLPVQSAGELLFPLSALSRFDL